MRNLQVKHASLLSVFLIEELVARSGNGKHFFVKLCTQAILSVGLNHFRCSAVLVPYSSLFHSHLFMLKFEFMINEKRKC